MTDKIVNVTEIKPTKVWVERDVFGPLKINMQHQGMEPFTFVEIHYDYLYTNNDHQHRLVQHILDFLGVKDDQAV